MSGLKDIFADQFVVGAALSQIDSYSPDEIALIKTQFNALTPENHMKPKPIEPEEGVFTFEQADALVAFAQENGMQVTGHCLVWHSACPDWFFLDGEQPADRDLVLKRLKTHITTLVGRYKGKVHGWDVVNEAISDGSKEFYRDTKWYKQIGEDYIEKAFEYAHAADPDAQLYYNDYSIETPTKRKKALQLIANLKAKGLRIDAVGIQGHWELDKVPFQDIEKAITVFSQAGVKVMITELDIDMVTRNYSGADVAQTEESLKFDPYANGCPPEVLARQAAQYAELFRIFRKHRDDITRVTFWGLHDGRSWLNKWPSKRTNYALLFDRQCRPKAAFQAVLGVAQEATTANE